MKKLVLVFGVAIMVIAAHVAFGQTAEGVITYQITVNMHRMLPPDQEARKAMIPEFRTFKEQLFFNASESLCKPLVEEEEEDGGNGGRRRVFQMRTQYYSNQGADKWITLQNMRGKTYLVQDSAKVSPWKFGTGTKAIAGYDCKMAYYTDENNKTVTAWYTDKLRPFLGPDRYNSLPGAVLAIDINNAERVIVALKVELRAVTKAETAEPADGEKISAADYKKMMDEQMKNFRPGGGGTFQFRN